MLGMSLGLQLPDADLCLSSTLRTFPFSLCWCRVGLCVGYGLPWYTQAPPVGIFKQMVAFSWTCLLPTLSLVLQCLRSEKSLARSQKTRVSEDCLRP